MTDDSQLLSIENWTFRVRLPAGAGLHPVTVLLHGWTGDENSMWIFAPRFPKDHLLILPRGIYSAPLDGYGWHPRVKGYSPQIDDFKPAVEKLLEVLVPSNFPLGNFDIINLAGFSQGAALAYTYLLLHPSRIGTVAGLSGLLPEGLDSLERKPSLAGKRVFIAHGTRDDLVPVEKARQAASYLETAGAEVIYCEDDVGHKLSLSCFRGLQAFYSDHTG